MDTHIPRHAAGPDRPQHRCDVPVNTRPRAIYRGRHAVIRYVMVCDTLGQSYLIEV